jgi:hypothetical protein
LIVLVLVGLVWLLCVPAAQAYEWGPTITPLGPEQKVFDWEIMKCADENIPDLPARAFRDSSNQVNLILSHYTSWRMEGSRPQHGLDRLQRTAHVLALERRPICIRRCGVDRIALHDGRHEGRRARARGVPRLRPPRAVRSQPDRAAQALDPRPAGGLRSGLLVQLGHVSSSLTYNTYFQKWMLLGDARDVDQGKIRWGFFYSTSSDLINWSPRQLFAT